MDFDILIDAEKAVTVEDNGDLVYEDYAATWGKDREGWRFEPDSFVTAAKSYLDTGGPLLVQHDPKMGLLGNIETADVDSVGVKVRLRIPKPADSSPLADWYGKIKRGMKFGLSVRGPSRIRKLADGSYAARMQDWIETSVTPTPVNTGGILAVSKKAIDDGDVTAEVEETEPSEEEVGALQTHFDAKLAAVKEQLAELEAEVVAKEHAANPGPADDEAAKAVSADQRKNAKFKMADGSFPINHCGQGPLGVGAALSDLGRTSKPRAKVLAHIRRAANALGCTDKYPALRS